MPRIWATIKYTVYIMAIIAVAFLFGGEPSVVDQFMGFHKLEAIIQY